MPHLFRVRHGNRRVDRNHRQVDVANAVPRAHRDAAAEAVNGQLGAWSLVADKNRCQLTLQVDHRAPAVDATVSLDGELAGTCTDRGIATPAAAAED